MTPRAGARLARRPILLVLALEIGYLARRAHARRVAGGALGIAVFFALRRPRALAAPRSAACWRSSVAALAARRSIPGRWTAARRARRQAVRAGDARGARRASIRARRCARTRLGLWRRTLAIYRAQPLVGVGLGNFPVLLPRHAEPNAREDGVLSATDRPATRPQRSARAPGRDRAAGAGGAAGALRRARSRRGGRRPAGDPARRARAGDGRRRGRGRRLPGGALRAAA